MTIYIDSEYKCHVSPGEGLIAVETNAFDGKCKQFIEGYRFVPDGCTLVKEDGAEFNGEMVAPWRNYEILAEFQALYEEMIAEQQDMQTALNELGVTVDG